jgi:hypothetical protein
MVVIMKPGQIIKIKVDRRFKNGNIKQSGIELRGNPQTMDMRLLDISVPNGLRLNPPIIVSTELGEAIKRMADG